MDVLVGPYLAAALLLVLAGAQKVADPKPLVRALKSVGAPVPGSAVRLAAAAETALGIAALITVTTATGTATAGTLGVAVAAGVALSYAGFTAFVLLAMSRGGVLASCGCFGKDDTPPTRTHAAVTGGLALAAATAPAPQQLTLALVSATAALAVTAYLVLAVLPLVRLR